jgi:hypothetical protein
LRRDRKPSAVHAAHRTFTISDTSIEPLRSRNRPSCSHRSNVYRDALAAAPGVLQRRRPADLSNLFEHVELADSIGAIGIIRDRVQFLSMSVGQVA